MIQRIIRKRGLVLSAALISSIGLFCTGCSDDETTSTNTTASAAPRNPHLEITSPADGACIAIGTDPDARIPIQLETQEMIVRPPDFCGSISGCGHFVLLVNGRENNIGTTRLIDVLLRKLADRYATFEITAEARDDDNEVLTDKSTDTEIPARATLTVTTALSCDKSP